jgi:PKD repeat protein
MRTKIFKKIFLTALTALLASLFLALGTAAADSWWSVDGSDDEISFTQYQGALAELTVDGYDSTLIASTDFRDFVLTVVNFALGFLGLAAVIIVIYGGVLYVASGGEEESTQKGKKAIQYATIGLLIVLGSFAFVNTVIRGASGQGETGIGVSGSGSTVSGGFNASAEQIRALAMEIYSGYSFLVESADEITGIMHDLQKESIVPENYPPKQNIIAFLSSVESKLENLQSSVGKFSLTATRTQELLREIDLVMDSVNSKGNKKYIRFVKGPDTICSDGDSDENCAEEVCPYSAEATVPSQEWLDDNMGVYTIFSAVTGAVTSEATTFSYYYADDYSSVDELPNEVNKVWHEYWCTSENTQGDGKAYVSYLSGMYDAWKPIHQKFDPDAPCEPTNDDSDIALCELIEPIAQDFSNDLERIFTSLGEIYTNYADLEPIKDGHAKEAYDEMASAYGFTYSPGSNKGIAAPTSGALGGAWDAIINWNLQAPIDEIGVKVETGLDAQGELYTAFKDLEFVKSVLGADTIEGAAPLVVTFDTLGTVDPAGGSIQGSNIIWDLAGTKTLSELLAIYDPGEIPVHDDVDCSSILVRTSDGDEVATGEIGQTSKTCIFSRPGTYTSAVKIKSNDASKYAPGVSVLTIKVASPSTKINLEASGAGVTKDVMKYDTDTGLLLTDKNTVSLTVDQSEGGVTFTVPDAGSNNVSFYKWDFGNGDTVDGDTTGTASTKYDGAGKYVVTLEVTNELGVSDKKIFTLEIGLISAQINVDQPSGAPVNRSVKFDAENSKSDSGNIINYKWTISPQLEGEIPTDILTEINEIYPLTEEGANLETYSHSFTYPLKYDIDLVVTDGTNQASDTYRDFTVTSTAPVAQFDYNIPDPTQPSTVNFDGSTSYDPDGTDYFDYSWTVSPATPIIDDTVDHGLDSPKPIMKFEETGDYEVTLKVTDQLNPTESHEVTKTVTIENILDVAWDEDQETAFQLDEEGNVIVDFELESDNAISYEADFGDGSELTTGDLEDGISHTYQTSGKFTVNISVYDEEDNANTISRRFFVQSGDLPIAKINIIIGETNILDLSEEISATKKDSVQFDAGESINTDGSGRRLKYSWNFGDTNTSSKKLATHTYSELSPVDPGHFLVKLTVTDEDDPTLNSSDEVMIKVENIAPKFSNVQGIPQTREKPFITPVPISMKVFGAEDEDGQITKYLWWYFNVDTPNDPIDFAVTQSGSAQLTIGTIGVEGEEITYGFGLEVTDQDGLTYSNQDEIDQGKYSTVNIQNGANEMPTANFSVSSTSIFAGEELTFTSSSSDPDGSITKFYWDFEGDGFFNNESSDQSTVKHTYTEKNLNGFDVKLKVIDDKGGESISDAKKIYVDSIANPPTAAFKSQVIDGSHGMKVEFINNSSADEEAGAQILTQSWDFDTASELSTADTDGDGFKDNDIDSEASNPQRLYTEAGTYVVKLSVIDNQGNTDEVTGTVKVPLANDPVAAFTSELIAGKMIFTNNSLPDANSDAIITKYKWDFDTESNLVNADSDGDGIKDNDGDSSVQNPEYNYEQSGIYTVKLTVTDDQGNEGSVTNQVEYSIIQEAIIEEDPIELPEEDSALDGEATTSVPAVVTSNLIALLSTDPTPGADGIIYLTGDSGAVSFNFSGSTGAISTYKIDQNIHYDLDQNGDKTDDVDFQSPLPGTWTANFEKEWGKIVVKLTVYDINGNQSSTTVEVKFSD